jgi:hypothetical protein
MSSRSGEYCTASRKMTWGRCSSENEGIDVVQVKEPIQAEFAVSSTTWPRRSVGLPFAAWLHVEFAFARAIVMRCYLPIRYTNSYTPDLRQISIPNSWRPRRRLLAEQANPLAAALRPHRRNVNVSRKLVSV